MNLSPAGPVARLNERLTNSARFSATLIPRSVCPPSSPKPRS